MSQPNDATNGPRKPIVVYAVAIVSSAVLTIVVLALLVNVFTRKQEGQTRFHRVAEVTEDTVDPAVWGQNWPLHYESYLQTVDYEKTRYGGSDAIPEQMLDRYPWLRLMWSGYAFSLDYRKARGHAFMLHDQDHTERVKHVSQPGACLHCHSSVIPAYRYVGDGDIMEGFRQVNAMDWNEARNLTDAHGDMLIDHPVSCVDCHHPDTMALRITRPAFKEGIAEYMRHSRGIEDYDVNRDATRQEMRSFSCAQCHVEYYFAPPDNQLTYPWSQGILVEEMEAYYDDIGFTDWTHGMTGAPMLKAQHPEFELWSQGVHAQAGVSCADCHMPYRRVGAMKISDHHVRSPLLDVAASCQPCHSVPETELLARAHNIQDRTQKLTERASDALVDLINSIVDAKEAGATDEQLEQPRQMHRSASWRLDFIFSENSHGFHAPQESARILGESIDYARRGVTYAQLAAMNPQGEPREVHREPVIGATPDEEAPPGRYDRGR